MPLRKVTPKSNPNWKPKAKTPHKIVYDDSVVGRRQKRNCRRRTLFIKAQELATISGGEVFVYFLDQKINGQGWWFASSDRLRELYCTAGIKKKCEDIECNGKAKPQSIATLVPSPTKRCPLPLSFADIEGIDDALIEDVPAEVRPLISRTLNITNIPEDMATAARELEAAELFEDTYGDILADAPDDIRKLLQNLCTSGPDNIQLTTPPQVIDTTQTTANIKATVSEISQVQVFAEDTGLNEQETAAEINVQLRSDSEIRSTSKVILPAMNPESVNVDQADIAHHQECHTGPADHIPNTREAVTEASVTFTDVAPPVTKIKETELPSTSSADHFKVPEMVTPNQTAVLPIRERQEPESCKVNRSPGTKICRELFPPSKAADAAPITTSLTCQPTILEPSNSSLAICHDLYPMSTAVDAASMNTSLTSELTLLESMNSSPICHELYPPSTVTNASSNNTCLPSQQTFPEPTTSSLTEKPFTKEQNYPATTTSPRIRGVNVMESQQKHSLGVSNVTEPLSISASDEQSNAVEVNSEEIQQVPVDESFKPHVLIDKTNFYGKTSKRRLTQNRKPPTDSDLTYIPQKRRSQRSPKHSAPMRRILTALVKQKRQRKQ